MVRRGRRELQLRSGCRSLTLCYFTTRFQSATSSRKLRFHEHTPVCLVLERYYYLCKVAQGLFFILFFHHGVID